MSIQETAKDNIGTKAIDALKNTGAIDTLTNLGLTYALGPIGTQVGEATNISDNIHTKGKSWFDDLSADSQKKYAEKHKESKAVKEAKKKGKFKQLKPKAKPTEVEKKVKEKIVKQPRIKKLPKEAKTPVVKKETKPSVVKPVENKNKKERDKRFVKKPIYRKGNIRGVPNLSVLLARAIELSAPPQIANETIQNALKALYLIMYYSTDGAEKIPRDLVSQSKSEWEPALLQFLEAYKVPKLSIQKLLNAAYENLPFSVNIDDLITKSGLALKSKKLAFEKDVSISKLELGVIKAFTSYFTRNSETAMNFLEKNLSTLREPRMNAMFAKSFAQHETFTPSAQLGSKQLLQKLVKKLTGKISDKLTVDQLKHFRITNPEDVKQYNALRRALNDVYKQWITHYVRQSGLQKVDYQKLYKAINSEGIENNLSPNFKGFIDDQLNYYTISGNLIDGKPTGEITMNPNYDSEEDNSYVFKLKTPMGESTYYTVMYKSSNVSKKFETVNKLEENIETIRGKWLKALRTESKEQLFAAQLELMYKFGARSGRSGNETAGEATFGITTLQVGHITRLGNGLKIKYKGKKGAEQIHMLTSKTVNDRFLIKILERLIEDKGRKDPVWTTGERPRKDSMKPELKEIAATSTLRYLKSISGMSNVKLHYVRHMMGNKLAREILKRSPLKKGVSQAKAEAWFKDAMKEVGKALAHTTAGNVTGMTSIKSYISPKLQKDFFDSLGLRTPAFVPKD